MACIPLHLIEYPERILSLVLFTIYMEDLSVLLAQSRKGCHILRACVSIMYFMLKEKQI